MHQLSLCHPQKKHKAKGLCLSCYKRQYQKQYREQNLEAERARIRKAVWKLRGIKITEEQVLKLKEKQGNRCAICNELCKLVVDHDHVTGNVRGLLCNHCNRNLVSVTMTPQKLRAAANYLDMDQVLNQAKMEGESGILLVRVPTSKALP